MAPTGAKSLSPAFFGNLHNLAEQDRITNIVEKRLHSNIGGLYKTRMISKILQDPTIYDESIQLKCKQETLRLTKYLSHDEIGLYLLRKLSVRDFDNLSHLIENVFHNKLKQYLIKRESETDQQKLDDLNQKIRQSWCELKKHVAEDEIVAYAIIIMKTTD